VEHALIRNAVADHAGGYYGGPLGLGRDSAARYTSEGHLHELVERHGLDAVWTAVAEAIDADPAILDRGQAQRATERQQREARAEQVAREALAAYKRGEHAEARTLIDQAELVDPTYRPGRGNARTYRPSWDEIRRSIGRGAAASAAGAADQPSRPVDHDGPASTAAGVGRAGPPGPGARQAFPGPPTGGGSPPAAPAPADRGPAVSGRAVGRAR
jgi:hypothetical protein